MARRIEIKGKARTYVAVGILLLAAWTLLGRPFFDFNLGVFSQGYNVALFRGGGFAKQGVHWEEHDRTLGTVVSAGGETIVFDLDAEISRGTLVVFAWRWPAFLFAEPMVYRARFDENARERLEIPLTGPGIYKLSVSGIWMRGNVSAQWRIDSGA